MPSIPAHVYQKHQQQGTLQQLLRDVDEGKTPWSDDDAPSGDGERTEEVPTVSPGGETDSELNMGLVKVAHVRKVLVKEFDVNPVGKPRQTQQDKWKSRPCVERYREFKDEIRYQADGWSVPESAFHIVFHVEAPKTKQERAGDPHHLKPDVDNLLKAFFDALEDEDKYIWDVRATARWCAMGEGRIRIYRIYETDAIDS